jgi:hypothetical protein
MNAQGKHEGSTDLLVMLLRSLRGSSAAGSSRSGESRSEGAEAARGNTG